MAKNSEQRAKKQFGGDTKGRMQQHRDGSKNALFTLIPLRRASLKGVCTNVFLPFKDFKFFFFVKKEKKGFNEISSSNSIKLCDVQKMQLILVFCIDHHGSGV